MNAVARVQILFQILTLLQKDPKDLLLLWRSTMLLALRISVHLMETWRNKLARQTNIATLSRRVSAGYDPNRQWGRASHFVSPQMCNHGNRAKITHPIVFLLAVLPWQPHWGNEGISICKLRQSWDLGAKGKSADLYTWITNISVTATVACCPQRNSKTHFSIQ